MRLISRSTSWLPITWFGQAPIDAKEDPATLGPGRYRVDIPSLDAGTWKIALAVGNEGSGTYTLDVAR